MYDKTNHGCHRRWIHSWGCLGRTSSLEKNHFCELGSDRSSSALVLMVTFKWIYTKLTYATLYEWILSDISLVVLSKKSKPKKKKNHVILWLATCRHVKPHQVCRIAEKWSVFATGSAALKSSCFSLKWNDAQLFLSLLTFEGAKTWDDNGPPGAKIHCSESPALKRARTFSAPRTARGAAVAMRGFNRWLSTRAAVWLNVT